MTLLGAIALAFGVFWALHPRGSSSHCVDAGGREWSTRIGIGAMTDFLDTLGIGSFVTTSALFRIFKITRDELIPGTMNVGHTLPTIVQALIYIAIIEVDLTTLTTMISASIAGAYLGANLVSSWSRRKIRWGMGLLLLVAAMIVAVRQLHWVPGGAGTSGLTGYRLVLGIAGNFGLGALMTLGIGLYAPCLILIGALGMDPTAGFPIMMGSCAFLMPVVSAKFVSRGRYDRLAALGLTLGVRRRRWFA